MKKTLLIILFFSSLTAFGQHQSPEEEVENILNTLIEKGVLDKAVFDFALQIAPYQFDGDYSRERVFPNASSNTIICLSPIAFEKSIHSVLKKIDDVYDSSYYQQLIHDYHPIKWSKQGLTLAKKTTFIDSRISALFYNEIGLITYPLFSKDGKTAVLTYGSVNRSSVTKKREAVYILKKDEAGWQIVESIASKKI